MDWQDDGIVLSARRHGETSAVVTLLTRARGVHAGLVRGGFGKRGRALIEPGNRVTATWRGRLAEHLGAYQLECIHSTAAQLLDCPGRLAGMTAALSVCALALPEREPHLPLFDVMGTLLSALEAPDEVDVGAGWGSLYVKWELGLLQELGFRLDLDRCAATGGRENLIWVSPKSATAVSSEAGRPYARQLLALPEFLRPGGTIADTVQEVLAGLHLTGFFLDRHVFAPHERTMPPARGRLVARLQAARKVDEKSRIIAAKSDS